MDRTILILVLTVLVGVCSAGNGYNYDRPAKSIRRTTVIHNQVAPQQPRLTYSPVAPQQRPVVYRQKASQQSPVTYSQIAPQQNTVAYAPIVPQQKTVTYSQIGHQQRPVTYHNQASQQPQKPVYSNQIDVQQLPFITNNQGVSQQRPTSYIQTAPQQSPITYNQIAPQQSPITYSQVAPQQSPITYTQTVPQQNTITYNQIAPQQVPTIINQIAPQPQLQYTQQAAAVVQQNPQVMIVQTPGYEAYTEALQKMANQAVDTQTIVYVLSKQPDIAELTRRFDEIKATARKMPEVRFIKYKTDDEAIQAQQAIQAQYESLPGPSDSFGTQIGTTLGTAEQTGSVNYSNDAISNVILPLTTATTIGVANNEDDSNQSFPPLFSSGVDVGAGSSYVQSSQSGYFA
ncbi:uncharacterized protein LOC129915402 [Episyrphus balteatus]|uniref:uncharacterized protein LOC129915402 n=1 Tax=Episyrphus balteatus TaxID=286459 RepID=UPI002485C1B5|nr:uncharacterized protein LOC129915402 [Episyrphus balteatus]